MTLNLPHAVLVNSLDLHIEFVRASSRSKLFGASVTGSWSKRGVFTWTSSMNPWKLTMVAMDAMTNVGIRKETGAGVMNGILLDMTFVGAMAGAAMWDGLTTKSCDGLARLTTPPGNGAEKLTGVPA